jgi:membrane protein YdbS with pleckstrin-like domain
VRLVAEVAEVAETAGEPAWLRRSFRREDATRWVWVVFGLAQAVITMLMAFDVIDGTTLTESVTAVALVVYVAVNELFVRPVSRR